MATPEAQAKAQALNTKLEGKARIAIDEIDRIYLRKQGRQYHNCAMKCYDVKNCTSEALQVCVSNCEVPHRQANAIVQQEVSQFQNRLGRAMQSCQDGAQDFLPPGGGEDPRSVQKAEAHLLSCMERTVDEYIGKLKPLQQRIAEQLKNLK